MGRILVEDEAHGQCRWASIQRSKERPFLGWCCWGFLRALIRDRLTRKLKEWLQFSELQMMSYWTLYLDIYWHIFLKTLGALVLVGRSSSFASLARYLEKTGAAVPPEGPLILLRSVILRWRNLFVVLCTSSVELKNNMEDAYHVLRLNSERRLLSFHRA